MNPTSTRSLTSEFFYASANEYKKLSLPYASIEWGSRSRFLDPDTRLSSFGSYQTQLRECYVDDRHNKRRIKYDATYRTRDMACINTFLYVKIRMDLSCFMVIEINGWSQISIYVACETQLVIHKNSVVMD